MKTTAKIFTRDIKKIFTNSMAIVLAVGIALLPSLYAWFNIYANWDPYGSTGNMLVAVIIEDEGVKYKNIEINVGQKIKENLSGNDAIDWQFVSKKEATTGVEAGKYYAAIEIPSGFSESLTSIVGSDFNQPKITYYANEKKNAIATKITDKVVQTVQQEVNESFVVSVINVLSTLLDVVSEAANNAPDNVLGDLKSKIDSATVSIDNIQKTVDSFESVMSLAGTLGDAVNNEKTQALLKDSGNLVDSGADMARLLQNAVGTLASSADSSLGKVTSGLNSAAEIVDSIGTSASEKAAKKADEALGKVITFSSQLESVKNLLVTLRDTLGIRNKAINKLVSSLETNISRLETVSSLLEDIRNGAAKKEINKITGEMNSVSKNISSLQSDYKTGVSPIIENNLTSLMDMLIVSGDLIADLSGELPTLKSLASSLDASIESGEELVSAINKLLSNAKKQLASLSKRIESLKDSEIVNTLQNFSGKNTEQLGEFIACPVQVETLKVYGIENYGSAMAPFYSTLAIWVGAMILIAVVKTQVKKKNELGSVNSVQEYFGRMFTFLLFSVTQALIICLGDLYFLKIQCYHPAKFLLAGVLAAVTFTVFVYSLGFTFGDVGKAVGIIFLVVQIGGSGGTFPIDVTPKFFQAINPYLPFTFVIEAMRECVCGTYSNDYWIDLLKLLSYIGIGLVIGIGIKMLVKKPVRFFEKQIEKTDIF